MERRGDLDFTRDRLFIAELNGAVVGMLAVRTVPFVHHCEITPSPVAHKVAEALALYATGYVRACDFREAIFAVQPDNRAMAQFLAGRNAACDPQVDLYTIGLD